MLQEFIFNKTTPTYTKKWSPLSHSGRQVNVDDAIPHNGDSFEIGIIFRNQLGEVRATMAKKCSSSPETFTPECLTFKEGLQLAINLDLMLKSIETDALNVISAIGRSSTLVVETSMEMLVVDTFFALGTLQLIALQNLLLVVQILICG
ncbi:hypothetical protein PanWU01x14_086660 [Parasponia andersonii]|uniref:RNase H type-1 domain-containing protein n=1 Tax=Parasponia andersonii TaxID=3476 RepID=A0A2P5D8A8_PARAD|nr:hypothetical protein PanWU01x14_086660 [Parasponia andersonii]